MKRNVTAALMGDPPPGRSAHEQSSALESQQLAALQLSKPAPPSQAATPALGSDEKGPAPFLDPPIGGSADADALTARSYSEPPPKVPAPTLSLRPIEAIQLHLERPPAPPPTAPPVFLDVDPCSLLVEAAYQREITAKGLAHIRKIAANWDWRRFRPPVVVMTDDGGLLLDGQHTAIAAASRSDLPTIPVQLVEAPGVADRAEAFIGLNTGQLGHTPVGLHKAAVAAGDVTACAVDRICAGAGVSVRAAFGGAKWRAGDTAAVAGVRGLLAAVGERRAGHILQALASAGLAPISATEIRAAEMIFTHADYADQVNPLEEGGAADLAAAVRALADDAGREAKVFAKAQCVPLWRALGIIWFRKMRKRRKVM